MRHLSQMTRISWFNPSALDCRRDEQADLAPRTFLSFTTESPSIFVMHLLLNFLETDSSFSFQRLLSVEVSLIICLFALLLAMFSLDFHIDIAKETRLRRFVSDFCRLRLFVRRDSGKGFAYPLIRLSLYLSFLFSVIMSVMDVYPCRPCSSILFVIIRVIHNHIFDVHRLFQSLVVAQLCDVFSGWLILVTKAWNFFYKCS